MSSAPELLCCFRIINDVYKLEPLRSGSRYVDLWQWKFVCENEVWRSFYDCSVTKQAWHRVLYCLLQWENVYDFSMVKFITQSTSLSATVT